MDEPAYEIVQAPGLVAITYEMIHEARIIPLAGHSHVGPAIRSYMGDATGYWDEGSLVIETTNFRDTETIQFPLGASTDLRTIERLKLIGPKTVEWLVTFVDPSTWARPWTLALNFTRTESPPFEYACHEGNLALRNILISARVDETAAAEAARAKAKQ